MKFLNFGSIQEDIQGKVKQDLKFKTGKFVWRVRFSAPLDPATVNNKNLYVTKKKSKGKVDMVVSLINAVYLLQQDYFLNQMDFVVQVI